MLLKFKYLAIGLTLASLSSAAFANDWKTVNLSVQNNTSFIKFAGFSTKGGKGPNRLSNCSFNSQSPTINCQLSNPNGVYVVLRLVDKVTGKNCSVTFNNQDFKTPAVTSDCDSNRMSFNYQLVPQSANENTLHISLHAN